jgi:hypothetical protein
VVTVTDLVAFLLARLDEDERWARQATPGPWAWSENHDGAGEVNAAERRPDLQGDGWERSQARSIANESATGDVRLADAVHIARHDPARLLADIAAKRQIVDEHANGWEGWEDPPTQDDIEQAYCVRCQDRRSHDAMRWPCPTLKLLALPFADHPDYDEKWRP